MAVSCPIPIGGTFYVQSIANKTGMCMRYGYETTNDAGVTNFVPVDLEAAVLRDGVLCVDGYEVSCEVTCGKRDPVFVPGVMRTDMVAIEEGCAGFVHGAVRRCQGGRIDHFSFLIVMHGSLPNWYTSQTPSISHTCSVGSITASRPPGSQVALW